MCLIEREREKQKGSEREREREREREKERERERESSHIYTARMAEHTAEGAQVSPKSRNETLTSSQGAPTQI